MANDDIPDFGNFGQRGSTPDQQSDVWKRGRDNDSDETEGHVAPVEPSKSVNAPEGQWVDVPKGMIAAPGTYVDEEGYLRCVSNGAYAAWHNKECPIRHLDKEQIVHDTNGAPWCPDCYMKNEQERERKKIAAIFASGSHPQN